MIPTNGGCCITPWDISAERSFIIVEIEDVPSKIAANEKSVLFGETMIELGVEIIEIIPGTIEAAAFTDKRRYEGVYIRSSAR